MGSKRYRYTYDNMYLADQQRDFYEENGYIVIPRLVPHALLDECEQRFLDICRRKVDKGMTIIAKDLSLKAKNAKEEYVINKIHEIIRDEVMFKYSSYDPILDIAQSIIGPNITCAYSMMVNKPPNSDKSFSRHPLHQDYYYFPVKEVNSIVATWTAMESIDEQNGCLFVVPGSHKGQMYKHDYPLNAKNKGYHEVIGLDDVRKVNLIMDKGDTVFFHPLLLHGSGPNLSQGFRRAISSHYIDSDSHPLDVKGTVWEKMVKELLEEVVKLGYPKMSYNDLLKVKSVLMRGSPGNLQNFESHL